jgi:hypothetical protein
MMCSGDGHVVQAGLDSVTVARLARARALAQRLRAAASQDDTMQLQMAVAAWEQHACMETGQASRLGHGKDLKAAVAKLVNCL